MSKKDHDVFDLRVRFSVALADVDDAAVEAELHRWIAEAERLFDKRPSLKIGPQFRFGVTIDGEVPSVLEFASDRKLQQWMNRHFDNIVGDTRSEGCLVVLVVDKVRVNDKRAGSHAFFPHCVEPFGRKHGILMRYGQSVSTFAHELGHAFGLKHTFERYFGLKRNCNKGYEKGDKGKGTTVRKDGKINLMDYGRGDREVYLNECQRARSAKQRRLYLTSAGETDYRKLRGIG